MQVLPSPLLLLLLLLLPAQLSATDEFLFNGFAPSDLLLYGNASVQPSGTSPPRRHLSLTTPSNFSVGRALFPSKLRLTSSAGNAVLPFSTSFIFSISKIPSVNSGHGIALLFSPLPGLRGSTAAQHLGLFNFSTNGDPSNGVLAVEFDVFRNEEFNDIDANHVGINVFSLTSNASHTAGYFSSSSSSSFVSLTLNSGHNYQAWVDYSNSTLNVTLAPASLPKPPQPLLSAALDLSTFFRPEMYVGFCAATGKLIENHRILAWSFSTSNLSLSDALVTSGLPDFVPSDPRRGLSAGPLAAVVSACALAAAAAAAAALYLARRRGRRRRKGAKEEEDAEAAPMEGWESEYWPHRIGYDEVAAATGVFAEENLIGSGGNGRVYRGVLAGEAVAVKRFYRDAVEGGAREFLAEVASLGRLRHRSLVGLKGWSKRRGGDLVLVYEYMENGSLEGRLFGGGGPLLDWPTRVRVLRDVAEGVLYLHEGWERRVIHRDIKASNVMLDAGMAGRLGDFGQARVGPAGGTTQVVGTAGYMAPEVVRRGKATAASDVYAFGVLTLEVASGRRAVEEGATPLVEWAREMVESGAEGKVVEGRVREGEGYEEGEGRRVVRLGLWCTCEAEGGRPGMREVVTALEEEILEEGMEGASLERRYRGALGVDPGHGHPSWEQMGMSTSASFSGSDLVVVGR